MAVQSVTPAEPASNRLLTGKAKMLLGSCRSAQIHMWRGRDVGKGHAHSSCAGRRTSMPPDARAHAVGPKLKGARERNTPRAISTCACLGPLQRNYWGTTRGQKDVPSHRTALHPAVLPSRRPPLRTPGLGRSVRAALSALPHPEVGRSVAHSAHKCNGRVTAVTAVKRLPLRPLRH